MAKEIPEINLVEWIKENHPDTTTLDVFCLSDGSQIEITALDCAKEKIVKFVLPIELKRIEDDWIKRSYDPVEAAKQQRPHFESRRGM